MTIGRIPSVEGGIQPTIVDAKGDLIAAVAADSVNRLAVGSNDQVLVADSSTSTGLAWKSYGAQFVAGKNKIINGDFGVWQRGTSFSITSGSGTYTADRFAVFYDGSGGTRTVSQQTFTPGTAPVSGYEGSYFYRLNQSVAGTSGTYNFLAIQKIEDVRTFAGQTVTFSFWAKADTSRTVTVTIDQIFGTGGSTGVNALQSANLSLTTSWQRFSVTGTMPSISGKTIGTNSSLNVYINAPLNTTFTIDTWGWQLEAGSVATPFTTATGTIQGELAACQRYYYRISAKNAGFFSITNPGYARSGTLAYIPVVVPSQMRTVASLDYSGIALIRPANDSFNTTGTWALQSNAQTDAVVGVQYTHGSSIFTQGELLSIGNPNNATSYLGFSAEL